MLTDGKRMTLINTRLPNALYGACSTESLNDTYVRALMHYKSTLLHKKYHFFLVKY